MKIGIGCLTVVVGLLLAMYFAGCKKEIDYILCIDKFRQDTFYQKFDPLKQGNTLNIRIKQNYICEHSFTIVYYVHRDGYRFTMGHTGKFHFKLSSGGKVIKETTVTLDPTKSTPGAVKIPGYYRH